MKSESTHYAVRNSYLAHALSFITNQKYTVTKDINNPDKKVFTFERTKELENAMTEITQLKQKYSN